MFCIKTIVLMTLGFFVSSSIFRISYQTGKDNDAADWEISGFGGSRNVENSQVYRHLERLPFLYRIRYNRCYTETSIIPKSPWKADKAWLLAEIFGITFYWILYSRKQKMPPRHRNSV